MKIDILSLFPEMYNGPFTESILKRAQSEGKVEIEIQSSPSKKDSIRKEEDNKFIVRANALNELGQIVLIAKYDGTECATKTVEIIPLW